MRCLRPNSAERPASALFVAAALPGGDPLAAALAAGETPSPEMVAAAGEEGVLGQRAGVALLSFTLTGLIAAAFVSGSALLVNRVSFPKSADVLEERAREIIALAEARPTLARLDDGFLKDVEEGIAERSKPWNPPSWE